MRGTLLAAALALLAAGALAGCLGDEAPAGQDEGSEGAQGSTNGSAEAPAGTRSAASSPGTVHRLALAVYEGIDPATVEPYVPGNMTPVDCIEPSTSEQVDVTLIVGQRSYAEVPGEEATDVGLIGCAERPEGLAREDANEPPWVGLTGWLDGDAHARFLDERGFPVQRANVSIQDQPQGFSVSAEADGATLLEGQWTRSPAGVPAFPETSCEPVPMDGRSIVAAENGSFVALDWNKTEAICPAEATVTWPDDSPVAEILGPAHAPDIAVDVDVEEARYRWHALPAPGAAG